MKESFERVFLDASHQASFERDGFVVMDFLTEDEVASLSGVWEDLDDEIKSRPFSATVMSTNLSYRRTVNDAIKSKFLPRLRNTLENYKFCHGAFTVKLPGMQDGEVMLHQDQSFVDEERYTSFVAFVPLSDVTVETGCLRAVRGSHRLNHGPRGTYRNFPYPDLQPVLEGRFLTDLPMRAGQVCLMPATLFHGSLANFGERPRVAICALATPEDSQMLYYYQDADDTSAEMELFRVPDEFYVKHVFGLRPEGMESAGFVEATTEPLTLSQLESICIPGSTDTKLPSGD